MQPPAATPAEKCQESTINSPGTIPDDPIYCYNLGESERPGGLKVRFKIRVATGAEADLWDARQAQAIKELLQWSARQASQ